MNSTLSVFLWLLTVLAVVQGAFMAASFLRHVNGIDAAHSELARITAARIAAVRGGPYTWGEAFKDFLRRSVPWGLAQPAPEDDLIAWGREVQNQARAGGSNADHLLWLRMADLLVSPTAASESTAAGGSLTVHATTQTATLLARVVPAVYDAADLEGLRTAFVEGTRQLRRASRGSVKDARVRWAWSRVIGRLADYIGRGTALSLLFAALFAGGFERLPELFGVTSLIGGTVGAVVFAAHVLSVIRQVPLPAGFLLLKAWTWQPWLTVALFPTVIALGATALWCGARTGLWGLL